MKISKKITAIIVAIAVLAAALVFVLMSGSKDNTGKINENIVTETKEEVLEKAVFMYFVTNADLENKETKAVIEKVQTEYQEDVEIEIKNLDEDATILENFSIVTDKTPALIMLDKAGDISGIVFETNNYDELKGVIEKTLNK